MEPDDQESCASRNDTITRTDRIRDLNDRVRQHQLGGNLRITDGVAALGYNRYAVIRAAVAQFTDFTTANDPYAEHDFGALTVDENLIFFKIDYYDRTERYASPDPGDPSVTTRVLTIMLASEY